MSWDGANRSFLASALVGSLLAAYVLCGAVAGVLAPMLFARVSRDGWGTVFSLSLAPTLMLLTILAIGVARAGSVLAQQTLASHRLASRARELALAAPERLARASRVVGLDGRVALVAGAERFSFVHGLLRPRVVLSRGLLDRLSDVELQAVLEHERYHVTNLDPLKSVALRVLAAASFFVPALGELHARYAAARELAADRRAIAACGTRSLAGALLHAVHRPAWSENEVAVSLSSGQAVLRGRIEQLETGVAPAVASSVVARASLAALGSIGLLAVGLSAAVRAADFEPFQHMTVLAIAYRALLEGITCAAPLMGAAVLLYALLALRQRIRLTGWHSWTRSPRSISIPRLRSSTSAAGRPPSPRT